MKSLLLVLLLTYVAFAAPLPFPKPLPVSPGWYGVGGWTLVLRKDGRASYTRERFDYPTMCGFWCVERGMVVLEQWGETYSLPLKDLRRMTRP